MKTPNRNGFGIRKNSMNEEFKMKSIITPVFVLVLMSLIGFAVMKNLGKESTVDSNDTNPASVAIVDLEDSADFEKILADSDVPVLFDFHASWCPPCKTQGNILHSMEIPVDKAKIIKIDVDKHPELSRRFNVQSIPLLMVYEDGEQTYRQTGLHSAFDISSLLDLHWIQQTITLESPQFQLKAADSSAAFSFANSKLPVVRLGAANALLNRLCIV